MSTEQNMIQLVVQAAIEAAKSAIMAVREADNLVNSARPILIMLRSSCPVLR